MRLQFFGASLGLATVALLGGCGGGNPVSSINTTSGIGAPGQVQLLVSDAPLTQQDALTDVSGVNVTITRVDLLFDGKDDSLAATDPDAPDAPPMDATPLPEDASDDWVTIFSGEKDVDLLALANKTVDELSQIAQVANIAIPSGQYKRVRITMAKTGSVVKEDGTTVELRIPSGAITMPIRLYVSPDETEVVLTDFVLHGNLHPPTMGHAWYSLTPGVRLAKMHHLGAIQGDLHVPQQLPQSAVVTLALYDAANAQPVLDDQGQPIVTVVKCGDEKYGLQRQFTLLGVPVGTYTLRVTVDVNGQEHTTTQTITIGPRETVDLPDPVEVSAQ